MAINIAVSTGAADRVPRETDSFQSTAFQSIGTARAALDDMLEGLPALPDSGAVPGVVSGNVQHISPGNGPVWSYNFTPPTWNISPLALNPVVKTPVEDFTGSPPVEVTPSIPTVPTPEQVTKPGAVPDMTPVIIPDAPILAIVPDPKEWAITLPVAPILNMPEFTATKPSAGNITKPNGTFNWQEDPYTSETLDKTVIKVGQFLDGGVGIPNTVWEMIWAKDNDKENRAAEKLIDEINTEWSGRGFQMPQGIQLAQVQEIRQGIQSTSSDRARDIAMQEANLEIENLKFAVQQGIALENLRGSWYQSTLQRGFEAAKFASEFSISIFNAEITFYNAQVQMYLADIQVFKAEIDAELALLEVYKSELEGQKIVGELNLQQVQIYTSRIQALNLEIDRYNSILTGVKTIVDVDAVRVDAYRAEVQAYSERVKAVAIEYDAYATAMQGAKIQSEIYATNVSAFSTTVDAYTSKVDAEVKNTQIDIEVNKLKIEEFDTKVKTFVAELESAVKELDANSTAFDAQVRSFVTKLEDSKALTNAQNLDLAHKIEIAQQTTQTNITNATVNSKNAIIKLDIIKQALQGIADINSAYASSALSAVNISQSISDSAGNSASV